jgi:hypothetical protein
MGRYVLIRDDTGGRIVEEATVPTEAALHDVLMRYPALVPAAELGFGRTITLGYEMSLISGSADLVQLDEYGRLCLVEVKKEGNPDTRRVIAQLLDYAAGVWGLTLEEFEPMALRWRLRKGDERSLPELIAQELVSHTEDPDSATEAALDGLRSCLRSGSFALVVAAPTIPARVRRVIEYLNSSNMSVYGLEVSYFGGEIECFVPRVVAPPTLGAGIAGASKRPPQGTDLEQREDELFQARLAATEPLGANGEFTTAQRAAARGFARKDLARELNSGDGTTFARGGSAPIDSAEYFAALPDPVRAPVRRFLSDVSTLGGEVQWRSYGPRVQIQGESGPKVIIGLYSDWLWLTFGPLKGLPSAPTERAAQALRSVPAASVGTTFGRARWDKLDATSVERALEVARDYVRDFAPVSE